MEEKNFHSIITGNIMIPRETALHYGQTYVGGECCFRGMSGDHSGLYEVNLRGYLICALEKCDVKQLSETVPRFMRVSLFTVLKYWFKAWIK